MDSSYIWFISNIHIFVIAAIIMVFIVIMIYKKKIMRIKIISFFCLIILLTLLAGCSEDKEQEKEINRLDSIPENAIKITPDQDEYPPIIHSDEWEKPTPLPSVINTAGAEDSPFIPCCQQDTLYFFFTPNVSIPAEKQVLDGVTGIYETHKKNGIWSEPERVTLQDSDKLSLDGCVFVLNDTIWFCSAREGYTGVHWFKAEYIDNEWANWQNADFKSEYGVGELHFSSDWKKLYFHSNREGGHGGSDIWVSENINGEWQEPVNLEIINTVEDESMPFLNSDGSELWFNRIFQGSPAIYRSKKIDKNWTEPQLIISQFAGEPTLDINGNIFFVHHFYKDGKMLEADIYVCYHK